MSRLFFLILTISMGSCAGIGVIAALAMGRYAAMPILVSAGIGAAVGVVVAWIAARKLEQGEIEQGRSLDD